MDQSITTNWQEEKERLILQRNRSNARFSCALQWLELLEDGAGLLPYFIDHKCSRIAIYGAADIGRILLKEIERNGSVKVSYFLDRNAERQREKWGLPVYLPDEFTDLPDVDLVVVTAINVYESVFDNLFRIRPEIPVVSLSTIIEVRRDEVWYGQR